MRLLTICLIVCPNLHIHAMETNNSNNNNAPVPPLPQETALAPASLQEQCLMYIINNAHPDAFKKEYDTLKLLLDVYIKNKMSQKKELKVTVNQELCGVMALSHNHRFAITQYGCHGPTYVDRYTNNKELLYTKYLAYATAVFDTHADKFLVAGVHTPNKIIRSYRATQDKEQLPQFKEHIVALPKELKECFLLGENIYAFCTQKSVYFVDMTTDTILGKYVQPQTTSQQILHPHIWCAPLQAPFILIAQRNNKKLQLLKFDWQKQETVNTYCIDTKSNQMFFIKTNQHAMVALPSQYKTLKIFVINNTQTPEELASFGHPSFIKSICFNKASTGIATGTLDMVFVWDLRTKNLLQQIPVVNSHNHCGSSINFLSCSSLDDTIIACNRRYITFEIKNAFTAHTHANTIQFMNMIAKFYKMHLKQKNSPKNTITSPQQGFCSSLDLEK